MSLLRIWDFKLWVEKLKVKLFHKPLKMSIQAVDERMRQLSRVDCSLFFQRFPTFGTPFRFKVCALQKRLNFRILQSDRERLRANLEAIAKQTKSDSLPRVWVLWGLRSFEVRLISLISLHIEALKQFRFVCAVFIGSWNSFNEHPKFGFRTNWPFHYFHCLLLSIVTVLHEWPFQFAISITELNKRIQQATSPTDTLPTGDLIRDQRQTRTKPRTTFRCSRTSQVFRRACSISPPQSCKMMRLRWLVFFIVKFNSRFNLYLSATLRAKWQSPYGKVRMTQSHRMDGRRWSRKFGFCFSKNDTWGPQFEANWNSFSNGTQAWTESNGLHLYDS